MKLFSSLLIWSRHSPSPTTSNTPANSKMHQYLLLLFILSSCPSSSLGQSKSSFHDVPILFQYYSTREPFNQTVMVTAVEYVSSQMKNCMLRANLSTDYMFVISYIPCPVNLPVRNDPCGNQFLNLAVYLRIPALSLPIVLVIKTNAGKLKEVLRDACSYPSEIPHYNLTGTFFNYSTVVQTTRPNDHSSAKTSLFTIIFLSVCVVVTFGLGCVWSSTAYFRRFEHYRTKKRLRKAMAESVQQILSKSPVVTYDANQRDKGAREDDDPTCAICLETFKSGEKLRKLVCSHHFHLACIDPWLLTRQQCPLCNRNIFRNSVPSISASVTLAARNPDHTSVTVESSAPVENSNL